jgi:hypothetical protein
MNAILESGIHCLEWGAEQKECSSSLTPAECAAVLKSIDELEEGVWILWNEVKRQMSDEMKAKLAHLIGPMELRADRSPAEAHNLSTSGSTPEPATNFADAGLKCADSITDAVQNIEAAYAQVERKIEEGVDLVSASNEGKGWPL